MMVEWEHLSKKSFQSVSKIFSMVQKETRNFLGKKQVLGGKQERL
ncbi:hypothetical protein CRD_00316 [Raphidiopsis brookii D9]|nr:hypothetical protein CRD_00316 [Raphidiopsis brookii D9]